MQKNIISTTNKALGFLLIFLWVFPVAGQERHDMRPQLKQLLNAFGKQYASPREIKIDSIVPDKKSLVIYANAALEDIPFRERNVAELYDQISPLFPHHTRITLITSGKPIESLIPEYFKSKRADKDKLYGVKNKKFPLTQALSQPYEIKKGLQNRHIALWQSHGMYYQQTTQRWEWQRARMFGTVEDLYTQSIVLPYLTPMLENAGANVLIPRERDIQIHEVIIDNDNANNNNNLASNSEYKEINGDHPWRRGSTTGFAHDKVIYTNGENPFTTGSFQQATTLKKGKESRVEWIPSIPESGDYAVYVSYQSLPNSTDQAQYTIHHAGGETTVGVNQTLGGGTWTYLGHYRFMAGKSDSGKVTLTNRTHKAGKVITADGIKLGGGMGNIARSPSKSTYAVKAETSGYPRFTEAARYWLQWAGMPDSVYTKTNFENDLTDDIHARGKWVNHLKNQCHIPIDMALAFHSDAGITPNDSIIGTLGIYMSKDNDEKYTNGKSKETARDLTDLVLSQITSDIRAIHHPQWSRRGMWNQSYIEARIPDVPTLLLELLSHQNFADMRFGLDPQFRFTVGRAIYKGILRYVCFQNKQQAIVQPLPPNQLYTQFVATNKVRVGWKATEDLLEPTASPTAFVLYTRIGNGGFDNGMVVKGEQATLTIQPGQIYSFRIAALNEGGISFPSETLSVYRSPQEKGTVLVVNGFDRLSAPSSFESTADSLAGFLYAQDRGVPYIRDISFIGDQYEFRRSAQWISNDRNGHGDCHNNQAGQVVAGNTFDYPFEHGQAIAAAGYSFVSASRKAVESEIVRMDDYPIVDLILGKQRGGAFPAILRQKISQYLAEEGKSLLISGAHLLSDLQEKDEDRTFAAAVLKSKLINTHASRTGRVKSSPSPYPFFEGNYAFETQPNPVRYPVESADGLLPADPQAHTILRYTENNMGAGIAYLGTYRTCLLGFPLESLKSSQEQAHLMEAILQFFHPETK